MYGAKYGIDYIAGGTAALVASSIEAATKTNLPGKIINDTSTPKEYQGCKSDHSSKH